MLQNFETPEVEYSNKVRSDDRILVLRPIEGKSGKSSTGLVDPRLFKGENTLHIVKDFQGTLWSMRYDKGGIPPVLNQKFTSFKTAYDAAKVYFKSRNVEIVEVKD